MLCGTIPSLEEIRRFEARPAERRIDAWLDDLLHDRRCADYLAERFARAFVGTEEGPFLKFRRRRFVAWLSDAILENRRYDAVVRDLIADIGVWTDHPAVNFLAVTIDEKTERPDARTAGGAGVAGVPGRADRLRPVPRPPVPALEAGRLPRPGRLLRRVHSDFRGIRDLENEYRPPDRKGKESVRSSPACRSAPSCRPGSGNPRERLATWVTDSAKPEPRPRDGQPRLGPPVRPPAGRAGRRPGRRRRDPPGPRPARRRLRLQRL